MIKVENIEVFGWNAAIRGMRNPKNSWDKSDTYTTYIEDQETLERREYQVVIGEKDLDLAKRLVNGGPVHAKFRRMINVTCDITAPLYWWKEFDTYKVGTVANSCSTMHKIHDRPLLMSDFSTDHLMDVSKIALNHTIDLMNFFREEFIETKDKNYWWQMIQLLPSSYNQKRTVELNYEVLAAMYKYRKDHKQDEWREFCKIIEGLPYSVLITGENE